MKNNEVNYEEIGAFKDWVSKLIELYENAPKCENKSLETKVKEARKELSLIIQKLS